jgi:acyl-CoA reductase-like NAD-dependent aldehyde dehydrogenase
MGQNCIGIERIIVHVDQFDDLFAIFEENVSKMRVGSVMSVGQAGYVSTVEGGSMICGDRFPAIERLIAEAEDAGARVLEVMNISIPFITKATISSLPSWVISMMPPRRKSPKTNVGPVVPTSLSYH